MTSEMQILQNYVDGKFLSCEKTFPSFNPSTGEINAFIPDSGKLIVEEAVQAAKRAFPV